MSETTVEKRVCVVNRQGLHARPADLIVRLASRFQSKVLLSKGFELVDGKSILSILTLAAEQGTELIVMATGPDAPEAVNALVELIAAGFDEVDDVAEHQPQG